MPHTASMIAFLALMYHDCCGAREWLRQALDEVDERESRITSTVDSRSIP